MPLRPARRLPRRFRRPVSAGTRAFVRRRAARRKNLRRERWKRWLRRIQRALHDSILSLRRWLVVLCAGLALLLAGLLVFSPIVEVRSIHIQRVQKRLDLEKVQHVLKPLFGRRLLFLSMREVTALLHDALPDVEDIAVSKNYPSTLSVRIVLRPIIAALRIAQPQPDASNPAQTGSLLPDRPGNEYLTDNGFSIALPRALSGGLLPTITMVDWTVFPAPNTLLLLPDLLARMQAAEQAITRDFGQQVRSRTVFLRAREFHLQTPSFSLWFDMVSPLADQLARYKVFLKTVGPKIVKHYVDLRLSGKVVYR
ncbi:FtsQ-type POTRA domain-containing protein [Candidatus Peregrinibacteria bacterium]|nr:FtsQ-type POTRA domain-containing protein [Candidatus Peregrinibacteria bacterium]MBI3816029.1 FtsQ-type POTRA domain-containing protein [Candidatus Peregrinibacteria bacterium]